MKNKMKKLQKRHNNRLKIPTIIDRKNRNKSKKATTRIKTEKTIIRRNLRQLVKIKMKMKQTKDRILTTNKNVARKITRHRIPFMKFQKIIVNKTKKSNLVVPVAAAVAIARKKKIRMSKYV